MQLSLDFQEAPPLIYADYQRLKQILVKLLRNAADASIKGAEIFLNCYQLDGKVVFQVKDHGRGIPQEEIDRVFARFESKNKKGHRGGAGLGLSIVKSFVGLHKGEVKIESTIDKGTSVTCTLPYKYNHETEGLERDIG